jgi:hypothetical protein
MGNGVTLPEKIQRILENRKLILLLDNFEHLLSGADFISWIIYNCPDVKVISTSREALHILNRLGMTAGKLKKHSCAARLLASFDALYRSHTGKSNFDDLDLSKEMLEVFPYYQSEYQLEWTSGKACPYDDLRLYLESC